MSLSTRDHPSPNSFTDDELVALAQKGDLQAFDTLHERYEHRIHVYISRMVGNDDIAQELTQDTFLKAWEMLLQLRTAASFSSWLYRIATNITRNYQRRAKRLPWLSLEESNMFKRVNEMSTMGSEKQVEDSEIVRQALARVSIKYRACLILYDCEGLSQNEIAERLGIKLNCVSKYISRGKEQFRQIYHLLAEEHHI